MRSSPAPRPFAQTRYTHHVLRESQPFPSFSSCKALPGIELSDVYHGFCSLLIINRWFSFSFALKASGGRFSIEFCDHFLFEIQEGAA